jgi:hypothetical protein
MTKEELFDELISDPLLLEKEYLSESKKEGLSFETPTSIKMLEVIKICINSVKEGKDDSESARALNKYLNK